MKSKLESELKVQIAGRVKAERILKKLRQRKCNSLGMQGKLCNDVCKRTRRRHQLKGFNQISQSLPFFGFDEADQPAKISIETKTSRMIN